MRLSGFSKVNEIFEHKRATRCANFRHMAVPPPPRRTSAYQRIFEGRDGQLETWLREMDRTGALPEAHAAIDNAYASGHAAGLEEGRAEHLDATRTLLLNLLEIRFEQIDERILDQIEEAPLPRLQRWILSILEIQSLDDLLER